MGSTRNLLTKQPLAPPPDDVNPGANPVVLDSICYRTRAKRLINDSKTTGELRKNWTGCARQGHDILICLVSRFKNYGVKNEHESNLNKTNMIVPIADLFLLNFRDNQ